MTDLTAKYIAGRLCDCSDSESNSSVDPFTSHIDTRCPGRPAVELTRVVGVDPATGEIDTASLSS